MFGGLMMAGVTPAWLGFSASSTDNIRPADHGARVGDLLFHIGGNSGGFPVIATAAHINTVYSGGDADAGPNGGGSPWTMIGLRGCTGVIGRAGAFNKHPRHAGLVLIGSGTATSTFSVAVDGKGLTRIAEYYSAPSLENATMSLFTRLEPDWPPYRDQGPIALTATNGGSIAIYELLGA